MATIYIRDVPDELIKKIDDFAAKQAGSASRASRPAATLELIRRGILRGDVASTVRRES